MTKLDDVLLRCSSTATFLDEPIVDVNQRGLGGDTPLHVIAGWGDLSGARALIEGGADVNAIGDLGKSPLFAAVAARNIELVKLLIDAGADPLIVDELNQTAAVCADQLGFAEVSGYLLRQP